MPVRAEIQHALIDLYESLFARFGPQHWWPGDSPTEIAIGAVLTQNTSWSNVEKAIANLRAQDALDFDALLKLGDGELAEIIRPAGYYNTKSRYLKHLANFVKTLPTGRLDDLKRLDLADARRRLLAVKGIGPETADSILLYACDMPTFVVDAYTRRVLSRHGLIEASASYDDIKRLVEDALPRETLLFNEFHALIVKLCKEHCRTTAQCARCPWEHHPHDASP